MNKSIYSFHIKGCVQYKGEFIQSMSKENLNMLNACKYNNMHILSQWHVETCCQVQVTLHMLKWLVERYSERKVCAGEAETEGQTFVTSLNSCIKGYNVSLVKLCFPSWLLIKCFLLSLQLLFLLRQP